jgi:hypothetical protein
VALLFYWVIYLICQRVSVFTCFFQFFFFNVQYLKGIYSIYDAKINGIGILSERQITSTVLMVIWGLRLSIFLFGRVLVVGHDSRLEKGLLIVFFFKFNV